MSIVKGKPRTAAVLALGLVVTALVGWRISRGAVDWRAAGQLGQMFSAVVSAAALLGVVASLRLQARQTKLAQLEAVRNIRTQLLQFAVLSPRFLTAWGFDLGRGDSVAQYQAYVSLVFSYLKMAFVIGMLSELELTGSSRAAFANAGVVDFWRGARTIYLNDSSSPRSRQFADIVERAFAAAVTEGGAVRRKVLKSPAPCQDFASAHMRREGEGRPRRPKLARWGAALFAVGLAAGMTIKARRLPAKTREVRPKMSSLG
ncbi:MAG TPA: DUF6082 family protein [Pilimelia sp.]|nr:DUF6082 family protein [Pilimelia sp.]